MFGSEQRWNQYNPVDFTIKFEYSPNCFSQRKGGKGGKRRGGK